MKKLYALLVGINEYEPPVTPLYGCIKDINKVEKYIEEYHSSDCDIHIKRLENKDATYENIIDGFKNHLSLASTEDLVWFHFSGHGSEEKSASEFASLEPNGKDQTLWCCDSGQGGIFNLADKELAVLLHEVSTRFPDGTTKESAPHVMVSLDCCHSGSGTRDAGESDIMRTRNTRSTGRDRPIDSYVGGYYANKGQNIQIPSSPHIVLSACQTYQRAGDLNDGGAFTSGLIKALKASKGDINYADLFIRTRASVRQIRQNQTPDFASIENFNPYKRFLASEEIGVPHQYEVFFEDNKWYIRCGAIHGLPTDNQKSIKVEIRSFPNNKKLGKATLTSIGAQRSALDIDTSFSIKSTVKEIVPGEDHYRGVIMSFPQAPIVVQLDGEQGYLSQIKDHWPVDSSLQYDDAGLKDSDIRVDLQKELYKITDLNTQTVVEEISTTNIEESEMPKVYQGLFQSFNKIRKWYSFRDLTNKNKSSKITDWVELELHVADAKGGTTLYSDHHVTLFANPENSRNGQFGFFPKAKIKNTTQDLFLYLMYMQPNFAIDCPEGEVVFYTSEHGDIKELELALWKNMQGFGPGFSESSVTSHFKLLVTTEKLDYFQFLQSGLGAHRSALSLWQPDKVSDDWAVINMAVTICRQEKSIPDDEAVEINKKISIQGNQGVQADISLAPVHVDSQQTSEQENAALLEQKNFELVDLRDNPKVRAPQVLELQNVRLADPNQLQENPIEIKIDQACSDNEMIIPMAFDGKYFRVAGDSQSDETGTTVSVQRMPTLQQAVETMKDYEGERSVFSSLKMAFFKLALNDDKTNKLSALILKDGELSLSSHGMAQHIMTSNNFLLILHGLMGDGISTCKDLAVNNTEMLKKYDCVLVYDYEGLNTSLDQTAGLLKKELQKLNFDQHENKTLDIVAHSCGGLVARWLIEQQGGSNYVKNLTMLGTPNAGSLFGKVEEYRSFALNILEVAANFMPHIIPGSGLLIKVLKFAGNLTPALGQMSPDSDFLTQLNTSADPKVKYNIIAGDASHVEQNQASSLINKLYGSSSRSVNASEVHDLFTTTESAELRPIFSMREIQPTFHNRISSHHFTLTRELEIIKDEK